MDITRIVSVVCLGMALTACASTGEPETVSSTADERNRMIAQMEADRADQRDASAALRQREAALERQTETSEAQNRTPNQR